MKSAQGYTCYGSYGGWNSGDEAILATVERLLEQTDNPAVQRSSPVDVIVWKMNPDHVEDYRSRGRTIIAAKQIAAVWSSLRRNQLVVGGGQLLVGDRSYKGLLYVLGLVRMAKWAGRPAVIVGLGVVGMRRRRSRWIARRIVAAAASVSCRDQHSVRQLLDAGCDPSKVRLSADVVLSGAIAGDKNQHPPSTQRRTIAVGVHRAPVRQFTDAAEMRQMIEAIADAFADHDVVVVSNDCRERFDRSLLDELSRDVVADNVRFQHFEDVDTIVRTYAAADCTVSVRMHPLILAMIHERGVVGIAHSQKVRDLADRVGFELFDPNTQSHSVLVDQIHRAMTTVVDLREPRQMVLDTFASELRR